MNFYSINLLVINCITPKKSEIESDKTVKIFNYYFL